MSGPDDIDHDAHRDGSLADSDRDGCSVGASGVDYDSELRALGHDDDEPDPFALTEMRSRIGAALFGTDEPTRLDRFVILDRLGQGGMGVVYSAYDPELDRRVAVKLLRSADRTASDGRARERLLREAQALARLSHPNVVPVHDVGVIDDQVFVVMEFVVGETLEDWIHEADRDWREVVAVYRQAGRGLAAAHAAGLVHRDFKPSNAVLGEDGRVRVLDFGLARGHQPEADGPESAPSAPSAPASRAPSGRLDRALTRTGALLGTPAFMSPEQLMGEDVGPASDQFSFCVALFQALYGERPFAGDDLSELGANAIAGAVRPEPRSSRTPGWLSPIVRRGLQPSPDARYPSMDALLAALGRDPSRTRRRAIAGVAVAALAALSVYSLTGPGPAAISPCQGGGDEIARVWNGEARADVERRIAGTGHPYAPQAIPRVAAGLAGYASAWANMHRNACLAHRRGEQSAELLDRRMACLETRKSALASAVAVLAQTSAEFVPNAVLVVEKLPRIEHCGDVRALAAAVPPPEDPDAARRVTALRDRLAHAKALEDHGELAAALAEADAILSESRTVGYQPLVAEALLVTGRIAMAARPRAEAIEPLRAAVLAGIATGDSETAAEALARLVYAAGTTTTPEPEPLASPALGEALVQRVAEPGFVHALLLNNAGAARMASGDRDGARALFEQALEVMRNSPRGDHIELLGIHVNLAMVLGDERRRAALLRDAVDELERRLGADHPQSLAFRVVFGAFTLDPLAARAILQPACDRYARHDALVRERASCLWELGALAPELAARERLGDPEASEAREAATVALDELVALLADADADRVARRETARGIAALVRGDPVAARGSLQEVIALARDGEPAQWWSRELIAQARLVLGWSALASGDHAEAAGHLDRALAVFDEIVAINRSAVRLRQRAWAWQALATALWDGRGIAALDGRNRETTREMAADLIGRAEAWYRAAGAGYERRLDELAAWRRARGVSPATEQATPRSFRP